LVGDGAASRRATAALLGTVVDGLEVVEAENHVGFFEALKQPRFDLVITDNRLHWSSGPEVVTAVTALQPGTSVLLVVAEGEAIPEVPDGAVVLERGSDFGRRLLHTAREMFAFDGRSAEVDDDSESDSDAAPAAAKDSTKVAIERPAAPAVTPPPLPTAVPSPEPMPAVPAPPDPPQDEATVAEGDGTPGVAAMATGPWESHDAPVAEPSGIEVTRLDFLATALVRLDDAGCIVEAVGGGDGLHLPVPTGPVVPDSGSWEELKVRLQRDNLVRDVRVRVVDGAAQTRALTVDLGIAGDGAIHGLAQPATLRRQVEEALRWTATQYRTILEGSLAATLVLDDDGTVAMVNQALERLLGRDRDQIEDRMSWAELLCRDDAERERADQRQRVNGGDSEPWQTDLELVSDDGESIPVRASEVVLPGTSRIAISLHDLRGRRQSEEEVLRAAFHDPITGLPNRISLLDRLEDRCERQPTEGLALLVVDVDRFRVVNDGLGHRVADALLRAVCKRLETVVGGREPLASLGGDTFAAILEPLPRPDHPLTTAMRIREAFATPFTVDERRIFCSVSIGVAVWEPGLAADGFLRQAETALHRAKRNGRDRWVVSDAVSDATTRRDFELENELRRALARHDFRLHFQPVADITSGTVVGLEALLRWEHPDRGLLTPDAFLRVAEESGLMTLVDRWVLVEACGSLAAIEDTKDRPAPWMSINLSPMTLGDPELASHLRDALAQEGIGADNLVLELVGGGLCGRHAGNDVDRLDRLRALGVRLSLDRFGGTGTMLASTGDARFRFAKLDRSLLENLDGDEARWGVVRAVLAVASSLELDAVAIGVETLDQVRRLRDLGCRFVQGSVVSDPVAADQLGDLLHRPVLEDL
jgi:diguanylate cyclase (GGDEF)-like protein/PAS domain S-box-containing protein